MDRETRDSILAVRYQERELSTELGGMMDPVGTLRRIEALNADGFSARFIGEWLGVSQEAVSQWRFRTKLAARTVEAVAAMYEKLDGVNPADMGLSITSIGRTKSAAKAKAYAPRGCWDVDTIDDPDAIPELTGACGTEEGYRIHIRETVFSGNPLPLCDPCRAAVETRKPGPVKPVFLRHNFARAVEETGKTLYQIAQDHYGEKSKAESFYRWRLGTRSPRNMGEVEEMAVALGCTVGSLVDLEAMKREADRPVVGHGNFNPYVLNVVLEMSGMSYNDAVKLSKGRFTTGAISKWVSGSMKPSDPEKLRPLAEHFGVDLEVFYQ